ncbi:MAG: pyruvate kinase [Saprospiraceae bacterium]|jgi:pyruvate kinase
MKINKLEKGLMDIYKRIVQDDFVAEDIASKVNGKYRLSAKNLYRYLILRSYDLRKYQNSLSDLGISALRSSEGYVFSNLFNTIRLLKLSQGKIWGEKYGIEFIGYQKSKKLLAKHASELFNSSRKKTMTEIMVTLPTEAAEDLELLRSLVIEGMEIARINLGHDDFFVWEKMVENIRQVQAETGEEVKIYMDLSGPKIRTSEIEVKSKKGNIKDFIKIKEGDHINLTKKDTKGKKVITDANGSLRQKGEVGVLLPQIIDDVNIGDAVFFDDGMIRARVISKKANSAELLITKAFKNKLKSGKGINLPDTKLNLPSLTDRDIEVLPFVCSNADIVGYSFVRTPEDVEKLYSELTKYDSTDLGVVLKIENKEAFENLPRLLFAAMKRNKIGVMIARGDLAVEIGFERIAEVQNQILWLCEAAHVPVIWATQVLENLAKTGIATRAEVSDAALSVQAECVMLNKGTYIVDAVRTLKEIILKMENHGYKKKNSMRSLNIAKNILEENTW